MQQPDHVIVWNVDMDASGRTLLTGWDGTNLWGRWSRPGGRWHEPFVLAPHVRPPQWVDAVVNRRGDALVAWILKSPAEKVEARYQPAGGRWTKPALVTRTARPVRRLGAGIGECGHAAVAWTTHNNHQIQVLRGSPTP